MSNPTRGNAPFFLASQEAVAAYFMMYKGTFSIEYVDEIPGEQVEKRNPSASDYALRPATMPLMACERREKAEYVRG